jgi:hypothetical protein
MLRPHTGNSRPHPRRTFACKGDVRTPTQRIEPRAKQLQLMSKDDLRHDVQSFVVIHRHTSRRNKIKKAPAFALRRRSNTSWNTCCRTLLHARCKLRAGHRQSPQPMPVSCQSAIDPVLRQVYRTPPGRISQPPTVDDTSCREKKFGHITRQASVAGVTASDHSRNTISRTQQRRAKMCSR